ncbi:MAG TPA: hypothetical protein VFE51_17725 [Verrucomicrobiae bacterium]|nr:hypothetical protein [Verrucomicrobiae bacterium]
MRNTVLFRIFLFAVIAATSLPVCAQNAVDELAQLKARVAQLEKQVQEMSKLLEPIRAQQGTETRRRALREKFEKKMAQDQAKYSGEQLREAEQLYQVANQKWGTPEAAESLQTMIKKYPDINRTGCAMLYVAQRSEGEQRAKYLRDCIEKFNECFYGDGVQVGAYARLLLADYWQSKGEKENAETLYSEIKSQYPNAVDHGGNLLINGIKTP